MNYALNPSLGKIKQTQGVLLASIALVLSVPGHAAPVNYTLTVVAKTGDTISGKKITGFKLPSFGPNQPAINASGSVAFYATYTDGIHAGEGIFTPGSLVLRTGDLVRFHILDGLSFGPVLNDAGTVVTRGLFSSGELAILSKTNLLVKTGDLIGGKTLTDVGMPAMNNNGTVAFAGAFSGGTGIFTQTALLAKSGQSIAGQILDNFGPPVINSGGTVAFQSWLAGGTATAIFTPTALLVKTGDTIGGKTLTDVFFGPALNSNGTVAFMGTFSGGAGVFTQKALLVQTGDTIGGPKLTSFGCPVINESGVVAFFGTYPGGAGIFTQTSPIVKTGDAIDGRIVTDLGQPAINSAGVVAFMALFSDGSSAIVSAQPKTTPLKRGIPSGGIGSGSARKITDALRH